MKIKECNCWQWPGPASGKRALLSTSMFGGWPCSYWPSYLYCQHAPCDGYNPPQMLALSHSRVRRNNCPLWVNCEYLSGGVHYTLLGFRGQCPHTGLWLLSCHITNIILIFRAAGRKIWACRLCNGRPSRRGAWLLFVHFLTCVIFLFVTVRIHYDFSYLILGQHASPFHTCNLSFHCKTN